MTEKKNIIWIASYPKSGNTWFRALITNILSQEIAPADINSLVGSIAGSRQIFDDITGIDSSNLTKNEILSLRPDVYRHVSKRSDTIIFQKIHDAFCMVDNHQPLIPAEVSKGIIYLIRNPLEITMSFANHLNKPIEYVIEAMGDNNFSFCSKNNQLYLQLEQKLQSWSNHVNSWTLQDFVPIHLIRYEDLHKNPVSILGGALEFLNIKASREQIQSAIKNSSFKSLKKQETDKGFTEKSPDTPVFFKTGLINTWEKGLHPHQYEKVVELHGNLMKKFGYLETY